MLYPEEMSDVIIMGEKHHLRSLVEFIYKQRVIHVQDFINPYGVISLGEPFENAAGLSEKLLKIRGIMKALGIEEGFGSGKVFSPKELKNRQGEVESLYARVFHLDEMKNNLEIRNRKMNKKREELEEVVDIPLMLEDYSGYTSLKVLVGRTNKIDVDALTEEIGPFHMVQCTNKSGSAAIFVPIENLAIAKSALLSYHFEDIAVPKGHGDPTKMVKDLHARVKENLRRISKIDRAMMNIPKEHTDFLLAMEQYLSMEVEKAESPVKFCSTPNSFIIDAWVPVSKLEELSTLLEIKFAGAVYMVEVEGASINDPILHLDVPLKLAGLGFPSRSDRPNCKNVEGMATAPGNLIAGATGPAPASGDAALGGRDGGLVPVSRDAALVGHDDGLAPVSGDAALGGSDGDLAPVAGSLASSTGNLAIDDSSLNTEDENADLGLIEEPPVLLKHSKLVKPFEFLIHMFSTPKYSEVDPTPLMAITFPIFFGFMVGDLGYGLGLIVMSRALKKMSASQEIQDLAKVVVIGGIVSALMGLFVFGEAFGIPFHAGHGAADEVSWSGLLGGVSFLPNALVNKLANNGVVEMLVLSFFIGYVHMGAGFILGLVNEAKRNKAHAVAKIAWFIILTGIIMLLMKKAEYTVVGGFVGEYIFFGVHQQGMAISGLVIPYASLLLIGAGGVIILLIEGIGIMDIFGLVSNTISYARLAGVAVAKGALALAFNTMLLPLVFSGNVGLIIFGAILLFMAHMLVLVLGGMSSGIQAIRLNYVESFLKFYKGGGIQYEPFGRSSKLVKKQISNVSISPHKSKESSKPLSEVV